jgi:hypothetical protein
MPLEFWSGGRDIFVFARRSGKAPLFGNSGERSAAVNSANNTLFADRRERSLAVDLARGVGGLAWQIVRLPTCIFLVTIEPLVRGVLTAVALLGILLSFFFKFSGAAPHFPFSGMFGMSLGCGGLLMFYYGCLRLFSR